MSGELSGHVENLGSDAKDALINGMRSKFQEIQQMPDGPEKEARSAKYFKFLDQLGPSMDPGATVESPDVPAAHVLDTISGAGLSRAVVGETGLAAAGKGDLARAGKNILRGLNPIPGLAEPVPSLSEYATEAGVDMNNPWKRRAAMAADFALPMGQAALVNKIGGAANVAEKAAAAGDLAGAKAAHAAALEASQPGAWSRVTQAAKDYFGNRGEAVGRRLQDWRFSEANAENAKVGKLPFSSTWRKYGSPGLTTTGIEEGVRNKVIPKLQSEISTATKDVAQVAPSEGTNLRDILTPLNDAETNAKLDTLGQTKPYTKAVQEIEDHARALLKNDPAMMAAHEEALANAGKPVMVQNEHGQPELTNQNGATAYHPEVPTDILEWYKKGFAENEKPMNVERLRETAGALQSKAKAAGKYSVGESPEANLDRRATGDLYHKVANKARDAELQTLETVAPEEAAATHGKYKDITSLLQGANNLDEGALKPPPMFSTNPITALGKMLVKGTVDPAFIGATKMLRSPYTRVPLNAYRAYGVENSDNTTDQANPWSVMRLRKKME